MHLPVDRQAFRFLTPDDGADIPLQIGSNLFPGFNPLLLGLIVILFHGDLHRSDSRRRSGFSGFRVTVGLFDIVSQYAREDKPSMSSSVSSAPSCAPPVATARWSRPLRQSEAFSTSNDPKPIESNVLL